MAFFSLSGITGCVYPTTGATEYAIKYNTDFILSYYKKDIKINFIDQYMVVCKFANHTQAFQFLSSSDRDTFYNSLP
jgi:hypothetical protein